MHKADTSHTLQFKGNITAENFKIEGVTCDVTLSSQTGEIGIFSLTPPPNFQLWDNDWPFKFSFSGTEQGSETIVELDALWYSKNSTSLKCKILSQRKYQNIGTGNKNVSGHFLLSSNFEIAPYEWLAPVYTGEILREKPTSFFSISLNNNITVRFNYLYNISQDDLTGATTMLPYLVAEFFDAPQGFIPSYQDIDDLLLVISFITRHSTICTGWELYTESSIISDKRRRGAHQTESDKLSMTKDKLDKEQLITKVYDEFCRSKQKESLRTILGSVSLYHDYISAEFFNLYSALESLIFIHRQECGLEFIMANFKPLKKKIETIIEEELSNETTEEKQKLLKANLKGINRAPYSKAFSSFIEHYKLGISDLWPATIGKGSLSKIRNRMIHGAQFTEEEEKALTDANRHLRLLFERCLLAYFNSPEDINWRTRLILCSATREHLENSKRIFQQN